MKDKTIRPANMRTVHGVMSPNEWFDAYQARRAVHSVSAVMATEEVLVDPRQCAASGSGMDAPEEIPTGSVKAFFNKRVAFGLCQRTTPRERHPPSFKIPNEYRSRANHPDLAQGQVTPKDVGQGLDEVEDPTESPRG